MLLPNVAFHLISGNTQLRAEPGPVIGYLVNSAVSPFSLDMYQLDLEIEKSGSQLQRIFRARVTTSVSYNWNRNRIRIAYVVAASLNTPKIQAETLPSPHQCH